MHQRCLSAAPRLVAPPYLGVTERSRNLVVAAEDGLLAFILPQSSLHPGTTYTIIVNGPTNETGVALPTTSLRFTTAQPSPVKDTMQETEKQDVKLDDEGWIPTAKYPRDWHSGQPNTPAQSRPPLQAAPGVTALSGHVVRLNGKPLANVTLQIDESTTRTDRNGQFLLTGLTPGWHELLIDGRTANRGDTTYGVFEVAVELHAGQTTVLPYTIWMPTIDTAHAVTIPSPTTTEVMVTTPHIPGLELLELSAVLSELLQPEQIQEESPEQL